MSGQVVRYLIASAVSAVVSLLLPIVLHEGLATDPETAVAISLFTAFVLNFFVLRHYVYRSAGTVGPQLLKFAAFSVAFRLSEYLLFLFLFQVVSMNYVVALFIALAVSFVAKFFAHRLFVFTLGAR